MSAPAGTFAPELIGDAWFGTGGRRLTLADLRGRVVLLDFWTLCCVNCHHVLAELRPLEEQYADVLTVIGVHSPKFDHEKNPDAVAAAVHRHGVNHPVLNDPHMSTWAAYGVRAWPTLVLIDPEGNVAATYSGEGHAHAIAAAIDSLVAAAQANGTLQPGPGHFVAEPPPAGHYLQPGKVTLLGDHRLLISDSGRHSLVLATVAQPNEPAGRIGTGERGRADGAADVAQFNEPYGHVVLPADVASQVGYDVVVADTGNHLLRGLRLADGTVRTIAGTGAQWMQGDATEGDATKVNLSTPWDVAFHDDLVFVAMAGDHRVWAFDPFAQRVWVYAGTTHEGLVDGAADQAWFAQPSALVPDRNRLWLIDSETSALRWLDATGVHTAVGKGLFDFGHVDGAAREALLQHPLGATVTYSGAVVIADAYNGALRLYDPQSDTVTTLARDLAEPSDVVVLPDGDALLVVEAAAGRLTRVPLAAGTAVAGQPRRTVRPPAILAPGEVTLEVVFNPPPGQKLDDRFGPSTQMTVDASSEELLIEGAGTGAELVRTLRIGAADPGVLHVAAKGASCDEVTGEDQHPACHMHQQDWGIPIEVREGGDTTLRLVLSGA